MNKLFVLSITALLATTSLQASSTSEETKPGPSTDIGTKESGAGIHRSNVGRASDAQTSDLLLHEDTRLQKEEDTSSAIGGMKSGNEEDLENKKD